MLPAPLCPDRIGASSFSREIFLASFGALSARLPNTLHEGLENDAASSVKFCVEWPARLEQDTYFTETHKYQSILLERGQL